MNTAKEIYLKIKGLFEAPVVIPAAPVAPATLATGTPFKLKDGTEISIAIKDPAVTAGPSVGDMVTINGAPAPTADYELEDGSVISVDGTGAITVVVTPAPVTQPDFQEPPAKTLEERISAIEAKINAAPSIPTGLATEAQLKETEEKLKVAQATIDKYGEVIKGQFELLEKLVDAPTSEPVTLNGLKKERFDKVAAQDNRKHKLFENMSKIKTQFQ